MLIARKSGNSSRSILVTLLAAEVRVSDRSIIMITYNKVILLLLSNLDTGICEVYTSSI